MNEEIAALNREKTTKRVQEAIKKLQKKAKKDISLSQLAREARISRQTLYNRPDLKAELDEANSLIKDKQNSKLEKVTRPTPKENRIQRLKEDLQKVKDDYAKLLEQNVALTEMNFKQQAKIAELEEKLFKDKVIKLAKRE